MTLFGKQIFFHILQRHPELIEEIYLAKEIDKKLFAQIVKANKKIIKLDPKKAQALSRGGNHQGFLMRITPISFSLLDEVKKSDFLLVLVGLTDVGNIGAIIRSAYALGVDGVVISGIRHLALEGVVRTSSGAALEMPIVMMPDTLTLLNELKQVGFTSYAADMSGVDVREMHFGDKKVLLMGSEGEGLSNKIVKSCDSTVKIMMDREFDSLNVSAAAAILCDRMR